MRNPFKASLPESLTYAPYPSEVKADTNSTVHSNAVYLDDEIYPDSVVEPETPAMLGDLQPQPDYDAPLPTDGFQREIVFQPGPDPHVYAFTLPASGSEDLAFARDRDGIPGTVVRNTFWGPVTGQPMDEWQVGARTQLYTLPPGYGGPVTGSPDADYAAQLAYAYYQPVLTDYSPAAATDAVVAAV